MLTVKHIERSGYESVISALSVSKYPKATKEAACDSSGMVVAFGVINGLNGNCTKFADGKIYIMNENGKTIANYDLDE